jgi:hypothetical protein
VEVSEPTRYDTTRSWNVAEGDDVVMDAKHLWCVVFKQLDKGNYHEFSGDSIKDIKPWLMSELDNNLTLIGHNILNADLEVFRRLLDISFTVGPDSLMSKKCCFIDTFTMSKRNNPDRKAEYIWNPVTKKQKSLGIHGLAAWAKRCGSAKIGVDDWSTQDVSVYIERCTGDVNDNEAAYNMMLEERT